MHLLVTGYSLCTYISDTEGMTSSVAATPIFFLICSVLPFFKDVWNSSFKFWCTTAPKWAWKLITFEIQFNEVYMYYNCGLKTFL
jgi:hypothetical protein